MYYKCYEKTAKIQEFKKVHFLIRNINILDFQYFFHNRQYKVFTDIVRLLQT